MTRKRVLACLIFALIISLGTFAQGLAQNHPGLHPVPDTNGKWGFIDALGRWRIAPKYLRANEFSDGVAYVFFWDGETRADGIVEPTGKFTALETNGYEVEFHDGLARFQTPGGRERKFGYMDKSGRVVIQPQFWDSGDFYEGRAWFEVLKNQEWLYGFIDKTGKVVVPAQFTQKPGNFADGLARVQGKQALGFINASGRFAIPEKFQQLDLSFSEGLVAAFVESERPRGVYLDRSGKIVLEIPLWQQRTKRQLDLFGVRTSLDVPFSEGLAPVVSFNKFGFIDKSGQVVIEPLFRGVQSFSEGRAGVKIIGSDGNYVWGYVDRSGQLAIDAKFREVHPFAGSLARVETTAGKKQLIDRNGRVVWEAPE